MQVTKGTGLSNVKAVADKYKGDFAVSCDGEMLMCHKVTNKNLLDSSPAIPYSQRADSPKCHRFLLLSLKRV